MEPNAWDRAQEAISRAEARDAAVVTPDNAVSPFDASATMIIPTPTADADLTQRLSRGSLGAAAAQGAPAPRPPADAQSSPDRPGTTRNGHVTVRARVHGTPLPPEPPTRPVEVSDPQGVAVRVAGSRPPTAPFAVPDDTGSAPDGAAEPAPAPRRPWWKRLFGG